MKNNDKKIVAKTTLVSKKTLVERIKGTDKNQSSLSKDIIWRVIDDFLEEINKALINGEEIRLPSHFTFKTVVSKPRIAMNLQTKKKMTVPAKRVPKIKFSPDLKEQIAKKK